MPPTLSRTFTTLALIWGVVCACSGDDSKGAAAADSAPRDTASREPAPARPPLTPASAGQLATASTDSTRPASPPPGAGLGLWDVAALEKRLDLQGMAPRKQPEPVRHPFLSVEGTAYLVGNAELQVFLYPDAAAVERDVARLDTVVVAPRGQKVKWPNKPTLIRNNNLAAILLGQNALQIERVQRALMAGLPPSP
jgi:hypothetical protein